MARKRQTLLSKLFSAVATTFGFPGWGYNATDPRRKLVSSEVFTGANRAQANELLNGSLAKLRDYCRHLERNNATARAAVDGLASCIVGTGIALEPDTGDKETDDKIRAEWVKWIERADVNDRDLYTVQYEACREMITAGEGIWRFVVDENSFGGRGEIPFRILPLEGEWLIDAAPDEGTGLTAVNGIVLDEYARPVSYLLLNPVTGNTEEVPADKICHIYERRRSLQSRGEPWLAPIIETLLNERDLVDAELYAAKQTAALAIAITSQNHDALDTEEDGDSTDPAQALRIGTVARLFPGEDVKALGHTRPSQQIAPFRQMLRGDIAAALRLSQRFLDRDVSRANYSSMRADMLDQERLLAPVREWFGHCTAGRVYKAVLPYLALRAGIPTPAATYRLLPDGQPYVDPQKDAEAAATAIKEGLSTHQAEIAKRGGDYLKVWAQLALEKQQQEELGLSMGEKPAPDPVEPPPEEPADDESEADLAEERAIRTHQRNLELARASAPAAPIINVQPAAAPLVEVRNHIPETPAPVVNVAVPETKVEVRNTVPVPVVSVAAPVVNVAAPKVNVRAEAAPAAVMVPAPVVNIDNQVVVPARKVLATETKDGFLMEPIDE